MDQLQNTLRSLLNRVQADPQMDDDDKADLIDLINEVVADPTPNNLEALALVIDEVGKSQEYLAAKEVIANYQPEEAAQEESAETPTEKPTENPPLQVPQTETPPWTPPQQ